jgi:cytosine/adenosine deaminase-related metal-dependent hydrolase
MWYYHLLSFITLACFSAQLAAAETLLFTGGTIIGFNQTTEGLEVYRNGTLLLADDRIVGIYPAGQSPPLISHDNFKVINAAGKIITPGFIDTHHHMWQTAFKTLGSNTSLIEYLSRYGEYSSAGKLSPEDVYVGQLAGLYEALNAGVTTILDHAHHTWDNATTDAGLQASIDSRARVFWSFAFHNVTDWTVPQQLPKFREIATQAPFNGTHTSLGIAYDFFGPNPWFPEVDAIAGLAR